MHFIAKIVYNIHNLYFAKMCMPGLTPKNSQKIMSILLQTGSPIINNLLQNAFDTQSKQLNLDAPGIRLLSSMSELIDENGLPDSKRALLELLLKYDVSLSSAMIKAFFVKESSLCKELIEVKLGPDEQINKCIIRMLLVFYEERLLEQNRHLLHDHSFITSMSALMWDNEQIKLIPHLVAKYPDHDFIQLILSKAAYYHAYNALIQLGLTQDIPSLLANENKLRLLLYIDQLPHEQTKKICLIFWVKGSLTLHEFKELVHETEQYPKLAALLIALDQEQMVIKIKELHKIALDPALHIQQSILRHFHKQLKQYAVKKTDLSLLNHSELVGVAQSLHVLNQAKITDGAIYRMVLKKNNEGQLVRLFLPELSNIDDVAYKKTLINLLFLGNVNGVLSQGNALHHILDKELHCLAQELRTRFICVKQMQDLGFNNDIISFAAEKDNLNASRFRQVILKVEEQCKTIHERLLKSSTEREKVGQWQRADERYRKTLYSLAYDAIIKDQMNLDIKLKKAEKEVLDIVDPQIGTIVRKAFIVIANIFITLLTIGAANYIKGQKTGNYWFFNQTVSGEELRALDKEIIALIAAPG